MSLLVEMYPARSNGVLLATDNILAIANDFAVGGAIVLVSDPTFRNWDAPNRFSR
jgi:hypothetical protein